MLTTTHLVLACALLTKPKAKIRNASACAGALIPDLSMAILTLYAIRHNIRGDALWHDLYWQEPWQSLSAISNSFPLYSAIGVIGYVLFRWQALAVFGWGTIFALAALLHLALDFPVHVEDAHQHFWPLTDWRFHAPYSYWDTAHHAGLVSYLESTLAVLSCIVLWKRFAIKALRIILAMTIAFYLAIPVLRYLLLTGH